MRTKNELKEALQRPGFTPSFKDLGLLLELLKEAPSALEMGETSARRETNQEDEGSANASRLEDQIEQALFRLGPGLAARLVPLLSPTSSESSSFERSICRTLGKLPTSSYTLEILSRQLQHAQPEVRRAAALALGKVTEKFRGEAEALLLAQLDRADRDFEERAIVEALGKVGSQTSFKRLQTLTLKDPEGARVLERARVMLERTLDRKERDLDLERAIPEATVVYHCRRGLLPVLLDELASFRPQTIDSTRAHIHASGSLRERFIPRTSTHFSFVVRGEGKTPADRILAALRSAEPILRTPGKVARFRLQVNKGKQRELQWEVASRVSRTLDWVRSDPRDAEWVLSERKPSSFELTPRPKIDPRFSYRVRDLPAASHPTMAAALARVAEVRPGDVVWDPFVGSALELIECGRLAPVKSLCGTDLDEGALEAAKANLAGAGTSASLHLGDARQFSPSETPTLIISNPPFGHRLLSPGETEELLKTFLTHAFSVLDRSGRLVWLSPMPEVTLKTARAVGFRIGRLLRVDAGALEGEIQVLFPC